MELRSVARFDPGTRRARLQLIESAMRRRCVDVDGQRILLARIEGSQQEVDVTVPTNMAGFGRIRHFRSASATGWPQNPLPGLPYANAFGKPFAEVTRAQLLQIAGCAMRCWYCFVPYTMLAGDPKAGSWFSAAEMLDQYAEIADAPDLLVLSGGSPDIAPEWTGWMMDALCERGLDASTYLWTDDNLSSDRLVLPQNRALLSRMEAYRNHARVCCLKGIDSASFAFTTQGHPDDFDRQLLILEGYLKTDLDLYGYITFGATNTDPLDAIRWLMDRIENTGTSFLSRIVPLQLQVFAPMEGRLDPVRRLAMLQQEKAVAIWVEELSQRKVRPIWDLVS